MHPDITTSQQQQFPSPSQGEGLGERVFHAALLWHLNLLRDLPRRLGRLIALLSFPPQLPTLHASRITHHASHITHHASRITPFYLHSLLCYLFDLLGGPEIAQFAIRLVTNTRPLTPTEITAAQAILGRHAIRYQDVRIAHDGVLTYAFRLNKNRAFTTWHTVNMPRRDTTTSTYFDLVVHELTHVYQYERLGTVYIGQALHSQSMHGRAAYDYGGPAGLAKAYAGGKRYADYNREQQGQIAQDYHARLHAQQDVTAYEPFIEQLRTGRF